MAVIGSLSARGALVGELDHAARERAADAEALLAAGRYASSIASGLYSLEIELKVVICRRMDLPSLPKAFQTHDLEDLMVLTGLSNRIPRVKRPRLLKMHWDEVTDLPGLDRLRYDHDPGWDEVLAKRVHHILFDPRGGVIPWLRKQASKRSL
jgi:hypothetical protein